MLSSLFRNQRTLFLAIVIACTSWVGSITNAGDVPPEPMVLNYHLMHPGGESLPGDPNAAYFLDGVYHLHYILQHPWKDRRLSLIHI